MYIKKIIPIYSLSLVLLMLFLTPSISFANDFQLGGDFFTSNPVLVEEEDCASCHQAQADAFEAGIHSDNDLTCETCHQEHETTGVISHVDLKSNPGDIATTCGSCHGGVVLQSYQESFHARALALGSSNSASCASCHDAHEIVSIDDPNSPVNKENISETCAECHVKPLDNYALGTEHKIMQASGVGAPQYWTFKFFIWLTILTVIGLIIHIQLDLFGLLRAARQKARK